MSLSEPEGFDYRPVVSAPWDVFLEWFSSVWQVGEHIALIGPTGVGKTTFAVGITERRRHVLAVDPKGEDDVLTASGFQRLATWPPPGEVRNRIADGLGAKLVIGGGVRSAEDFRKLTVTVGKAIDAAFEEGGWTMFLDELQVAAQMMRHSLAIQRNLVSARGKKVSMVTAYQAPSWVPTAASRQAAWLVVWPTRDEDVIKSIAAKAGRPRAEMQAVLHELPDFHCVIIGRNPRHPMVMTHPPKIG